jgi:DNA-binding transcriptional regulator of glucitol operon
MSRSTMFVILAVVTIAWLLQTYYAYKQVRHIQKTYKELFYRYRDGYYIGFGEARKNLLKKGCVVILVSDDVGQIVEAHQMSGRSVFERMKACPDLIGENIRRYNNPDCISKKRLKVKKTEAPSRLEEAVQLASTRLYAYMEKAKGSVEIAG